MRRLCRSITSVLLLAVLAVGCGSTSGEDGLVLNFIAFDSSGITQEDDVRPASADVDVVQDMCTGSPPTVEPFTQTIINATFRNEEAADIRMEKYTIHFKDPAVGVADFSGSLDASLIGGQCGTNGSQCAVDADCQGTGTCTHTATTISGIVLFDFGVKSHVSPLVWGQATSLTITFFGSDATQELQTTVGYVATFDDYCHCPTCTGAS